MKVAIVDGYVDEPSCLGVPPYISPYPRYIRGMLNHLKIPSAYFTAEQVREKPSLLDKFDLSIVIAGAIVPGKYLAAKPLSLQEVTLLPGEKVVVGGVALELDKEERERLNVLDFPFEDELLHLLCRLAGENELDFWENVDRFALLGSEVVREHPDFPHVICEIETYRGCYWGKCSFCMERVHRLRQRDAKAVVEEILALYSHGVRHFRLGRQTDFFTYLADFDRSELPEPLKSKPSEPPKPNPEKLRAFHEAIWKVCPGIKTLHLDNVNPKTLAEYPEESEEIVKVIVEYQTPGNVAAMGLESADRRVIRENSLCSSVEDVLFAIELVNRYGAERGYNGMPAFLPGLNFVVGLRGESRRTFELNYEFLENLLERGLLLRRINIRQVKVLRHTPLYAEKREVERRLKKHRKQFLAFKRAVRENVDREMLRRMLPVGVMLRDVRCEVFDEKAGITFGRQFGSYPLLVGIVGRYSRNEYLNVRVVGYGMRSITALPPVDILKASVKELEAIPGVGKKLARRIAGERAKGRSREELLEILRRELGDSFRSFSRFISH